MIETILICLGLFLGMCIMVGCITIPFWVIIGAMAAIDEEDKKIEKHIVLGDRRRNK